MQPAVSDVFTRCHQKAFLRIRKGERMFLPGENQAQRGCSQPINAKGTGDFLSVFLINLPNSFFVISLRPNLKLER